MNTRTKLEVRSFTCSWDNSGVTGGVANPQSWERGGRRGLGMVPFERALVSSCRASSKFSYARFRDIAAVVLQHTFPHPTSSILIIPYVSLGIGGWPLGYEERRCWDNCSCNQFPWFPTYVHRAVKMKCCWIETTFGVLPNVIYAWLSRSQIFR